MKIQKYLLILFMFTITQNNFSQNRKPNIVFILADDLGWSDTELYGTTNYFKTPNILRLAERGMVFTQAYTASPVCSPTRCSIMTGQHPARTGITHARCHLKLVRMKAKLKSENPPDKKALDIDYVTRMDTSYYTLAEALKNNGYVTGHFGKWHLGLPPFGPDKHGFDVVVPKNPDGGIKHGYFAPWPELIDDGFLGKPGEHMEDRMAKEAIKFIQDNKEKTFFLNYWSYSIHSPWSAKKNLTEKWAKRVNKFSTQKNPVYAAMIESFDDAVGAIFDELERLKLLENTIIIFYSDNGGNTYPPTKTEPKGYEHIPGTNSNPFRAGKGSYYEGGTRVPAIFIWPKHIERGSVNNSIISSVDLYPTILDLLNIQKRSNQIFDGKSFKNALKGEYLEHTIFGFRPLYDYSIIPAAWVRKGDWKAIKFYNDNEDQSDRYELYNLNWDVGETKNIANRFPEKLEEMKSLISKFELNTNAVLPKANPNYNPCH